MRTVSKQLGCFLLAALAVAGAEKMPTRELIDLALRKADSAQFRDGLVATMPAADLKAGTALLSNHAQGLFAVETSSTPGLFIDDRPASAMKQISDSHLWFEAVPLKPGRGHSSYYVIDGNRSEARPTFLRSGPTPT